MKDNLVLKLMRDFAESTGLAGTGEPRRYLWTDAFAVCNFVGLYGESRDDQYLQLACRLVEQVHHVLGRHRGDDVREGWISGLSEEEGERHPTAGGLRIGKNRPERKATEPLDMQLEWERDGQYYHYLVKWIHALYRVAEATGEGRYWRWAYELAAAAHNAFCYEVGREGTKRMYWKMSIDLGRPLVPSMGQHDPLEGLVGYLELQTEGRWQSGNALDLDGAVADTSAMCEEGSWRTEDPLGIGGLLDAASRLASLVFDRGVERRSLLRQVLTEARVSLNAFDRSGALAGSPDERLAFRELGLAIGLEGIRLARSRVEHAPDLLSVIDDLLAHQTLAEQIESFWSEPTHHENPTWEEHREINSVMLATSLAPAGYSYHVK